MITIAVTSTEYNKAEGEFVDARGTGFNCLCAPIEERELSEFVSAHGAKHVIAGVDKYAAQLYELLEPGSVIARFGVGYDGINLKKATDCGVLCTNTPGAPTNAVAELVVTLILAAARHIPLLVSSTKRGEWAPQVGSELKDKILAVIGCGAIGCRVARIVSSGFGMKVIGCETRDVEVENLKCEFGFADIVRDFGKAVDQADFISLHIPGTADNHHFINSERISEMPPKAWLVNTSRGIVVNENTLFDALSMESISGACLDVVQTEPYQPALPEKDLRTLDNVIMTPHCASSTQEACNRMARKALDNIRLAGLKQYDKMDLLNLDVLGKIR